MHGFARTQRVRLLAVAFFAVGSLSLGIVARAADKVHANGDVSTALRESVADEALGDEKARAERLDKLIEAKPDAPEPRWQRGLIKTADGWRDAAECREDVSEVEKKYLELRGRTADDVGGNKLLAQFCRKNNLADSAKGHWRRVLDFHPDDLEARKALGHIRFDDTWTTKEESKRVVKVRKEFATAAMGWSKKIPGWVTDWHGSDAKRKAKARENLLSIRDAAAIQFLYGSLAYRSVDDTLLLLEILCQIPDMESTRILAEYAVLDQSPQVLEICSEELRNRDEQSYVPQLLIGLSGPITSETRLEIIPQVGQVFYRHVFVRETQYDRQRQIYASDYGQFVNTTPATRQYVYYPFDDPNDNLENAKKRAAEDTAKIDAINKVAPNTPNGAFMEELALTTMKMMFRERQRLLQNMNIEETNNRISVLLARVFDENNGTPEDWWKWWNNRHEMQQASQKPLATQVQYQVNIDAFQVQNREPTFRNGLSQYHSCFVAGTPVVTPHGTRPIEGLRTGDLVLSQSIETGEIAWKPVVRPTTRPTTEVLKMTIGDESFVCTLKHPFWKVGRGWVWAKDLAVGDLVRTSNGSLPIADITRQANAPVYNLVVDDFSTYFVGKNQTLTHDITFRVPTLAIAPGVFPAKEEVAAK